MKKVYFAALLLLFSGGIVSAQETSLSAGGDASGSGGSISYSVGQVFYTEKGSSASMNEGVQQPYVVTVNIDKTEAYSFSLNVFPNPTQDQLNLEIKNWKNEALSVELLDVAGRSLYTQNIQNEQTLIPVQDFPAAVYFLRVSNEQKTVKTFKIIKN
jgi:hypothetical protein